MKDCVVAHISDNHFGHERNDPQSMTDALSHAIFRDRLLERIDMLVFCGDFWDKLLRMDNPVLPMVYYLIERILREAKQHSVIVRIIEGTPSHDAQQSKLWQHIFEMTESGCNFRYIYDMEIEYLHKHECHILYIRDEFRIDPEETLTEVHALLRSHNLEQVDIAIMHGMFRYQLPPVKADKLPPFHREEAYEAIVRTLIAIGHVHTHSRHGIIVAQGSFDRLSHGEEEPKGFCVTDIRNGYANVFFVENTEARIYKTIQAYGLDLEQTFALIDETVRPFPGNACIRMEAEPSHPLFVNMPVIQRKYPTMTWTTLAKESKTAKTAVHTQEDDFADWHPVHIDRNNIEQILMDRVMKRVTDGDDLETIRSQLKELA